MSDRREYAIERLIPPWSTNPVLPPGQPYAVPSIHGPFKTRERAEDEVSIFEPGTYRILSRSVTDWEVDTNDHS